MRSSVPRVPASARLSVRSSPLLLLLLLLLLPRRSLIGLELLAAARSVGRRHLSVAERDSEALADSRATMGLLQTVGECRKTASMASAMRPARQTKD